VHKIHVSTEAATCWGKGSDLLITSSTTNQNDAHVLTVIDTDPVAGTITVDREIPFTTTRVQDERFPVEVASLSRNFIIEAESDPDDALHGGHFMVKHTPGVKQQIEGIEFVNLGQQGDVGRYPLHFHMCGTVEGALVSKNVFKHSNQRGVVLHGSNNVTVQDNVLYDIKGHGYFLEDGAEQYNRFYRNLASGINRVQRLVVSGGTETDDEPSAFWMSNTMNYWEGNVIAGSCCHGYWIEPQFGDVRGPSKGAAQNAGMDRTKLSLIQFENNDVHSVGGFGMRLYPHRWQPEQEAQIVNLRAYRNEGVGISLHVDTNVRLLGGFYGDNGFRQIWSNLADEITVEGLEIVGSSLKFREALERANRAPRCDTGPLHGVSFSINRLFHSSTRGMMLKDVQFSDFDCGSQSYAIHAGDYQSRNGDMVYNAVTKFDGGITFDNVPVKISACVVESQGVNSLAFEDVNGDLNPNGSLSGFIVSNNPTAKSLAGGSCQDLDVNACLSYCTDVCLQTIVVTIDSTSEVYEMLLTDASETEIPVVGINAKFGASLPAGTFDVSFRIASGDGSITYLNNVSIKYEEAPVCTKDPTILNVISQTWSPSPTKITMTAEPSDVHTNSPTETTAAPSYPPSDVLTDPPTGKTPAPSSPPSHVLSASPTVASGVCEPKCEKDKGCNINKCMSETNICEVIFDLTKCAEKECKEASKCRTNGKCKYKKINNCVKCVKEQKVCTRRKKCCDGMVCRKIGNKKKCKVN